MNSPVLVQSPVKTWTTNALPAPVGEAMLGVVALGVGLQVALEQRQREIQRGQATAHPLVILNWEAELRLGMLLGQEVSVLEAYLRDSGRATD